MLGDSIALGAKQISKVSKQTGILLTQSGKELVSSVGLGGDITQASQQGRDRGTHGSLRFVLALADQGTELAECGIAKLTFNGINDIEAHIVMWIRRT